MGSFTPILLKFCQSTSYGLVSNGYEGHYDPSIFRPIFMQCLRQKKPDNDVEIVKIVNV